MTATHLSARAIIRLSPLGADENVADFLQGLITNDAKGALPVWAGLLSAQGKLLFDFLVWADGADVLLDCEADMAPALARRIGLYRLRRQIGIAVDPAMAVHWQRDAHPGAVPDPRIAALGWRWLAPATPDEAPADEASADLAWHSHRLGLGVAEGRAELGDGELLWLECNADQLHGVSFTKGCYVGQENTARMNWRQKINRRLVVVPIAESNPARQRAAWPQLGLALDHLRVEDISPDRRPGWMQIAD